MLYEVITSGVYLYIFFDTGVHQAYESLEYITNVQWYAGGVIRITSYNVCYTKLLRCA